MNPDLAKSLSQQHDRIDELRGEICALKGALAVLIAHLSLLTRAPHAKREEILRNLGSMLPSALAQIEHDASPAAASGFEQSIETLTHLARNAVQFDPVAPAATNTSTTRNAR
jgi:cytochrome c556